VAKSIPSYDDIYGSEYLNPVDLNGKTIRVLFCAADVRELSCQNQKAFKIVLTAKLEDGKQCKKLIAVNKTSAKQLATAWGKPDTKTGCKNWLDKLATLSHAKVQAFGQMKDCVLITPIEGATAAPVVHDEEPLDDLPDEPGANDA
jgi:hypothetical protein